MDKGLDGDLAASGSETLLCGGESLFAGAKVRFGFGWARWEKGGAAVTLFIPQGADARIMIIENAPGELAWTLRPGLAYENRDAAFAVTRVENGALRARTPRGGAPGLTSARPSPATRRSRPNTPGGRYFPRGCPAAGRGSSPAAFSTRRSSNASPTRSAPRCCSTRRSAIGPRSRANSSSRRPRRSSTAI
ncbi:MAG: hypothetical protein ACLUEK_15880 [Oscillospiraceae bacterium]